MTNNDDPVNWPDPIYEPFDLKKYKEDDPLPKEFYTRDVVTLSKDLLGKTIVRKTS